MATKCFALVVATSMAVSGLAQAATLDAGPGFQINQGNGYIAMNGAPNLKVGDSVRADAKGSGYLVYPDGCRVKLAPGSTSVVRANSPCSFKAADLAYKGPIEPPPPSDPGFGTAGLVAGALGLAVVGGTIAAVATNKKEDIATPFFLSP